MSMHIEFIGYYSTDVLRVNWILQCQCTVNIVMLIVNLQFVCLIDEGHFGILDKRNFDIALYLIVCFEYFLLTCI